MKMCNVQLRKKRCAINRSSDNYRLYIKHNYNLHTRTTASLSSLFSLMSYTHTHTHTRDIVRQIVVMPCVLLIVNNVAFKWRLLID